MTTPENPTTPTDETGEQPTAEQPVGEQPTVELPVGTAAPAETVPVATAVPASAVPATATPTTAGWPGVRRWLTPVLALLAVAVIGLFGGILIGQHSGGPNQNAGFTRGQQGFGGHQGGPGQGGTGQGGTGQGGTKQGGTGARTGAFGGGTTGTIESISGDSMVVEKADGSTVTVTTSGSTTVTTTTKSSVSDLKAGDSIVVRGRPGSGGDVSATSISEGALPARP